MKERGKYSFEHREHLADAILASPALDAIVAERVAALAEDEAALNAVWDAMESHGHNGIECRPEKPMDYTAVYVIHALAAVLAAPAAEQDDEPEVCKCGHNAWTEHGGVMAPPAGCDVCACTLDERQAAAGVTPQYATRPADLAERRSSDG